MDDPYMIRNVERAFYSMVKKGTDPRKLEEFFFTYYSQKLVLLNHVYNHMEGHLQGYTDHGPEHVGRILSLYERMLKPNIWYLDAERDYDENPLKTVESLNAYELYLLLGATLWHDAGNIFARADHGEQLKKVQERLNLFFVDKDLMEYTFAIAKSHTGEDSIARNIPSNENYQGEGLDLQFLAGVLRLADELEEGESRVDRTYYDGGMAGVQEDQKIFWETSLCIKKIEPKPKLQTIEITAKVCDTSKFKLFKKKIDDVIQDIAFLDELVYRIHKMNETRKYYMGYTSKYLVFKNIEFKLRLDTMQKTFVFDDNNGYKEFWQSCPDINPEGSLQGYNLVEQKL